MGGEDRALRLTARDGAPETGANGPRAPEGFRSRAAGRPPRRANGEDALRSMLSSARAHDRAAALLEDMAAVHPEEAAAHLESAERHRRWADNDRDLADRYGPRHQDPDEP
ncbi:hypothetical protein ABT299_31660 [Spirillospora sp. NPDC000708]|uniref:hypothetical protein n=1 Tax=Actinomadura TaxID=1988 RepID=UPI001686BA47|nr:hypothetical protein [Actinomadura sp. RB99]MBD2895407.1 hypothetical protein [Actinomadura sp. RB99]